MSENGVDEKLLGGADAVEQLLQCDDLKEHGKLWRGSQKPAGLVTTHTLDSGYKELNQQLHANGWPLDTITEFGLSQTGIGELRLLMPALRKLQQRSAKRSPHQQNLIWIAPPYLPYAPELIKEQIDVDTLTIVKTNSIADTLWAAEQALLAECCAAVLCWTGNYNLSTRELRRLQLAAEKTNTWHILLRHSDCLKQSSTSGLRIHLQANAHGKLDLHILKQPHGWGGQYCTLSLHPHYENWQRLPVHLLPHHNQLKPHGLPDQVSALSRDHQQQASVTVLAPVSALETAR